MGGKKKYSNFRFGEECINMGRKNKKIWKRMYYGGKEKKSNSRFGEGYISGGREKKRKF
jgi:hypothetical protein